jgi:hypothetical protein
MNGSNNKLLDATHTSFLPIKLFVFPSEQSKFNSHKRIIDLMTIKGIVREAEEGGYWAENPSIPGCATQGELFGAPIKNLYEAVEGCLSR